MSAQKKGWKRVLALAPFCPDDMEKAVATINNLQSVSEEQLKKWQQENLDCLDNHFNWERFCSQVLDEIESKYSPHLAEITSNNRLSLQASELESPYYWGRPINFYRFLKANLKYAFQSITANSQRQWRLIDWHKHY